MADDESESAGASSGNDAEADSGGYSPEIIQGNKRRKSEKADRISALPDSVIQLILSFLPSTKQAIRTGILSKRWQNQWTRVPVLIFDSTGKSDENFSSFIDRTLMLHDCSEIKKFQIRYDDHLGSDPEITSKIRFATRKQVKDLVLHLCPLDEQDEDDYTYTLPKFLFDNAWLAKLELFKCYFSENLIPNWSNLKELRLELSFLYDLSVQNLLSGCPLLELLELTNWEWWAGDIIASNSLKKLSFVDFKAEDVEDHFEISCLKLEELSMKASRYIAFPSTRLPDKTIDNVLSNCPFLHTLELPGFGCHGRLVIASRSLKKLVLGTIYKIPRLEISCPNLDELDLYHCKPSVSGSEANFDRKSFAMKILRQLQHVKFLDIGSWFIQTLEAEGPSSLLLNCKSLTMDGTDFDKNFLGIVSAIRCSPLLEKLVIKFPPNQSHNTVASAGLNDYRKKNGWNSDMAVFPCLVSNLKIVKVIGLSEVDDNCKLVFNFVEFLLKNGRVLEKIVVILADGGKRFILDVSNKLLSLPRYSPHTTIELYSR